MICVSIAEKTFDGILFSLDGIDFAEIRLDLCEIDDNEIQKIFSLKGKTLIATCREGRYNNSERVRRLLVAIEAGAAYVDLEVDAEISVHDTVAKYAKSCGCKLIISHHDFEKTPVYEDLCGIVNLCCTRGADAVKLVTTALSPADNARVLSLYDRYTNLVAFAMGDTGKITRIACLYLGAPFTYAALSDEKSTASGQLSLEKMRTIMKLL